MKTIVTHHSPDMDGITGIWLLKKFHPGFADASVTFVPAGETLNDMKPDADPDILHVDTGLGRFDHHQSNAYTCGAKLVFDYLVESGFIAQDDRALERLVSVVVAIDHGKENEWPDPESDVYDFTLLSILNGWKMVYPHQENDYVTWNSHCLDGVYQLLQSKVDAEKEFGKGLAFETRWGKGIGIGTYNDGVLEMGIRRGYAIVFRKDPKKEYVRVTGDSRRGVDLTQAYAVCQKEDPLATWFLHSSKVLLRNGSTRNPKMRATKLTVPEMIQILREG